MTKHSQIETRSAVPLEIRSEQEDADPVAAATQAVEELRTSATAFETRQTEALRAAEARIVQLETRLNRPGTQQENRNERDTERRAFDHYLRHYGTARFRPDEIRALNTSDDGALVPEQFILEIIKDITEYSPMRQLARVTNATGSSAKLPRRLTKPTVGVVAEGAATTGSESTYGEWDIPIYELREFTDISNQMIEDSGFDMEAEIRADLAEAFGEKEGNLFFTGTGTNEPLGLLNDTDFKTVVAADLNLDGDELIDLFYAVKSTYARRGAWGMNRKVIASVRKLKNTSGDYLWSDSIAADQPPTFLGKPVVEVPALGDIAAGAVPVVFGDWNRGFRILDRIQMSILRDNYSRATNGQVRFHGRRRVGGKLVQPEALIGLKLPI
ncbi:phage major capsid protein [Phyllobacterium phragmitis]|uniref:Phage capsid-like C-terminal domain-containing protein n=1 Tax=Phyllobacterium phragmitis TaxID=2670329 RepID=A0ABQ0GYJ1_9HYPH